MPLTLRVLSYKGQSLPSELSAQFDKSGGTIGRKVGNTLVLPDPDNFVSGHHAEIIYLNDQYQIKDTSKNGTYLMSTASNLNNAQIQLQNNETLRIGEYEILVELVSEIPAVADLNMHGMFDNTPFAGSFAQEVDSAPFNAANPPGLDGFPFLDRAPAHSPFQDSFTAPDFAPPFGGPLNPPAPAADPFAFIDRPPSSPFQDSFTPPNVIAPPSPPKDVEDFLKGLDALSSTSGAGSNVIPEPIIPVEPPVTPTPFGNDQEGASFLQGMPEAKPDFPPSPFGSEIENIPPGNVFGEPAPNVIAPISERVVIDFNAEAVMPAQVSVASPSPMPKSEPATTIPVMANNPADMELMYRFLEGAGINDRSFLPPEQWAEAMKATGGLFRTIIEGLMDVLRARAEMKSEFRVSVTTIRSFDNNPLKFNPDVESVLKLMMSPNNPAFINPNDAAIEAFKDIKYHQIAMTAGIQASLGEIVNRFSPEVFEKILGEGIFLQKKARCWELYCEKYPELRNMALEDFFGEEFADAYEKQMSLLSRK